METGTKVTLAFFGGAIAGAALLAYLNRDKIDWEGLKPAAADLLSKGEKMKDTLLAKYDMLKDELAKINNPDEIVEADRG